MHTAAPGGDEADRQSGSRFRLNGTAGNEHAGQRGCPAFF